MARLYLVWAATLWLGSAFSFAAGIAYGRISTLVNLSDTLKRYGRELWPRVLELRYGICPDKDCSE
jgi:hypothetical protein